MKTPFYKSKKRIEQDLARNAEYDKEHGYSKEAKYEQEQEDADAAGRSAFKKYKSPAEKHCTPMAMTGHVIHKHMGGAPFHKAGNPDLEYMPVVKDATGQRPGVSSLVYDPLHKPAVSLGKQDLKVSSKKPSFAKPTRSELRKSRRADRIEQRISKKQKQLNKFGSSYDKARAEAKAGRIAKMQKRADRLK